MLMWEGAELPYMHCMHKASGWCHDAARILTICASLLYRVGEEGLLLRCFSLLAFHDVALVYFGPNAYSLF
jgi:hypothetical protein